MKTFTKFVFLVNLALFSIVIYGCIDEPVNPDDHYVSGTIYDGGKSSYINYVVSAGEYPVVIADNQSNFSLNVISKPYDLVITQLFSNFTLKISGLTVNHTAPVFDIPIETSLGEFFSEYLCTVKFPPLKEERMLYVKYITDELSFQSSNFYVHNQGDSSMVIHIWIPQGKREFHGKLFYLEAKYDYNLYAILSYEKFGIKNFDHELPETLEDTFKIQEISFDPQETSSNISITPPPSLNYTWNEIFITFDQMRPYTELMLYSTNSGNSNVMLPILPIENYSIKLSSKYGYFPSGAKAEKHITFSPGENVSIIHKEPPILISPKNGEENVDRYTQFEISDDNSPGVFIYDVYRIDYESDDVLLRLITNKRKLNFADFLVRGFEWKPSNSYYWTVRKLPEFVNVDELSKSVYTLDNRYNSIEMSLSRSFKTAP